MFTKNKCIQNENIINFNNSEKFKFYHNTEEQLINLILLKVNLENTFKVHI